jgi:hypothetical protein
MNLSQLRKLGFDRSEHIPFTSSYRVSCSCCEALTINGNPTHERDCPQNVHECLGCYNLIPTNQRYCEDCL